MLRPLLRPYAAYLLLLCLLRTLLPEAGVLAWHDHAHTSYEPAFAAARPGHKPPLLLTTRHQHCHAEQFYDVPFVAGVAPVLPRPRLQPRYRQYVAVAAPALQCAAPAGPRLRGPPAAGQRGFAADA